MENVTYIPNPYVFEEKTHYNWFIQARNRVGETYFTYQYVDSMDEKDDESDPSDKKDESDDSKTDGDTTDGIPSDKGGNEKKNSGDKSYVIWIILPIIFVVVIILVIIFLVRRKGKFNGSNNIESLKNDFPNQIIS